MTREEMLRQLRAAAGVTEYEVRELDGGDTISVTKRCEVSGVRYRVDVAAARWRAWKDGARIQDAMPMLDADQRNFLMTHYTPSEWDRAFGGES